MKRILLIDDDSLLLEVMRQTLSQAGYEVSTAADGKEASALYASRKPDIVITDVYMPNKDGLEALMELRENFPHIKLIAMSGGVAKTNLLEVARVLGASCTLVKPFQPEELLQAVSQVAAS